MATSLGANRYNRQNWEESVSVKFIEILYKKVMLESSCFVNY